jgi:hypothetical protein
VVRFLALQRWVVERRWVGVGGRGAIKLDRTEGKKVETTEYV